MKTLPQIKCLKQQKCICFLLLKLKCPACGAILSGTSLPMFWNNCCFHRHSRRVSWVEGTMASVLGEPKGVRRTVYRTFDMKRLHFQWITASVQCFSYLQSVCCSFIHSHYLSRSLRPWKKFLWWTSALHTALLAPNTLPRAFTSLYSHHFFHSHLTFVPWSWRQWIPPKCWSLPTRQYGILHTKDIPDSNISSEPGYSNWFSSIFLSTSYNTFIKNTVINVWVSEKFGSSSQIYYECLKKGTSFTIHNHPIIWYYTRNATDVVTLNEARDNLFWTFMSCVARRNTRGQFELYLFPVAEQITTSALQVRWSPQPWFWWPPPRPCASWDACGVCGPPPRPPLQNPGSAVWIRCQPAPQSLQHSHQGALRPPRLLPHHWGVAVVTP